MAKILIVDDHIPFRAVLSEALSSLKHHVMEAGSGAKSLEMLKHAKPDIVPLDLRMPDLSGLQALKSIRENLKLKNDLF
jgi:CheY-like chemotaxis protein